MQVNSTDVKIQIAFHDPFSFNNPLYQWNVKIYQEKDLHGFYIYFLSLSFM